MPGVDFSPFNPVIRRCLAGISKEEAGERAAAANEFRQAWNEAPDDFEKFLTAFFLARVQDDAAARLNWLEKSLQHAEAIDDLAVKTALPTLYSRLSEVHDALDNKELSRQYADRAILARSSQPDPGPFYHGTRAALQPGDLLVPGGQSNYQSEIKMNHIYFTALQHGAVLAATLAKGDLPERVYQVEPTGVVEPDPNLTDKKFPGNPTRSYRSIFPLRIVAEVKDWKKQDPKDIREYREKLDKNKGEIIN